MVDENSLGPQGPNILSIEAISPTEYSVEGDNFATEFKVEVRNGVGQAVEGVEIVSPAGTGFTLVLPAVTTGPYTLVVFNPDRRSSTLQFDTPGTSASNSTLRADS